MHLRKGTLRLVPLEESLQGSCILVMCCPSIARAVSASFEPEAESIFPLPLIKAEGRGKEEAEKSQKRDPAKQGKQRPVYDHESQADLTYQGSVYLPVLLGACT